MSPSPVASAWRRRKTCAFQRTPRMLAAEYTNVLPFLAARGLSELVVGQLEQHRSAGSVKLYVKCDGARLWSMTHHWK